MKQIIALQGVCNSGKSQTIRRIYENLVSKYVHKIEGTPKLLSDIRVIVSINGVKIGFESQGDPNSRLKRSLKLFKESGCDIIVCATRTYGMTVDWVKAMEPPYQVAWLPKPRAEKDQYEVANEKMADEVLAKIEKEIKA